MSACTFLKDLINSISCAGEKIDMPVFFYIDPEFATDDRLKSINHLTLSYTFFNVDEEEVELDGEVVPASALIGRESAHTAPAG